MKLSSTVLKNKSIILIDDSSKGTNTQDSQMLYESCKEVHVRIACPEIKHLTFTDRYATKGIDIKNNSKMCDYNKAKVKSF